MIVVKLTDKFVTPKTKKYLSLIAYDTAWNG